MLAQALPPPKGLGSGGGKGLAEASLTRSIPESPFELDGGPPTSSEMTQLKLNATWVAVGLIAGDRSALGFGAIFRMAKASRVNAPLCIAA
jgi:hypothetical protein